MINRLNILTGNRVSSNNKIYNLVDLLLNKGATSNALYTDSHNTLSNQSVLSGNMVGSDNKVYNIIDLIQRVTIRSK